MASGFVADFDISRFAFGFTNSFDRPFVLSTALGDLSLAQTQGLCGGMTFATLDYYFANRTAPDQYEVSLFTYLCDRQTDSLDLPFGLFRYMTWQASVDATKLWHGVRVREGISHSTIVTEWPKIRQSLDAGRPAPLALIRSDSSNPQTLTQNHQVLAYGYNLDESASQLVIQVCDPNAPRDPNVTLTLTIDNPDSYHPAALSTDLSKPVRGFFLSNYAACKSPPVQLG